MKIIEKYMGDKTYMFPNGAIATPEAVLDQFPAALTFAHIVETDENGEIMWAMQNLSAMCSFYNIDPSLGEEEKISAIQDIVNAPDPALDDSPTAEERQAAALEAIADGQTTENASALNALLTGEEK